MPSATKTSDKTRVGDDFPALTLPATFGPDVQVPDPDGRYVHLQLRRFAGCPFCNLHLRSVVTRHDEISAAGIREVVVFHSTADELIKHETEMPFPVIPDPDRDLYRRLGVERRLSSVLRLGALRTAFAAVIAGFKKDSPKSGPLQPALPTGGRLGLPADFLIAPDGRIAAVKYGEDAYDQWTVDELLAHARRVSA